MVSRSPGGCLFRLTLAWGGLNQGESNRKDPGSGPDLCRRLTGNRQGGKKGGGLEGLVSAGRR